MTINIAVVTSEALVFGCDSISSSMDYFIPAFGSHVDRDENDGSLTARYSFDDVVAQVTNSYGGVTKMFHLHGGDTPVAAVTAGLAKLSERTMSSYAHEFLSLQRLQHFPLRTVQEVAQEFLSFLRRRYEEHYRDSETPEEFRDGPLFLVGGYGAEEHLPTLCRLNVQRNTSTVQYPNTPGSRYGIAWEGQSDAVERLMRGYDTNVRNAVETAVSVGMTNLRQAMAEYAAELLQRFVDRVGVERVGDMQIELPALPDLRLPWDGHQARVHYGNLPLQDAIDFAAYLVNLQSGRAKFGAGVATVGGRTHIGVITKQDGFVPLGEPELTHRNTGFV